MAARFCVAVAYFASAFFKVIRAATPFRAAKVSMDGIVHRVYAIRHAFCSWSCFIERSCDRFGRMAYRTRKFCWRKLWLLSRRWSVVLITLRSILSGIQTIFYLFWVNSPRYTKSSQNASIFVWELLVLYTNQALLVRECFKAVPYGQNAYLFWHRHYTMKLGFDILVRCFAGTSHPNLQSIGRCHTCGIITCLFWLCPPST